MTLFLRFNVTVVHYITLHLGETKCFVNEVCKRGVYSLLCVSGAPLMQVWAESRTSGENRHRILQMTPKKSESHPQCFRSASFLQIFPGMFIIQFKHLFRSSLQKDVLSLVFLHKSQAFFTQSDKLEAEFSAEI